MQPNFTLDIGSYELMQFPSGELQPVFRNSKLLIDTTLEEIRSKLKGNL